MSLYSADPRFGFEADFDSLDTFVISQALPHQSEQTIYLHPQDAEDLITQLNALLKRLKNTDQ